MPFSTRFAFATLTAFACLAAAPAALQRPATAGAPSRFLYVLMGNADHKQGDFLAVVDIRPRSARFGQIIARVPLGVTGSMPHHAEMRVTPGRNWFANGYMAGKTFVFDTRTPSQPALVRTIATVPGLRKMHSFERLPDGHVLVTMQFGDGARPGDAGGLAEFDDGGSLVRQGSSADARFPGARIRTYSLTVSPKLDRVVTTSAPMDSEVPAHVVQVWRLSDLKLLRTIPVPQPAAPDSSGHYPFEARFLADGRVLMNTYNCGLYLLEGVDREPSLRRVYTFGSPAAVGCSVPLSLSHFWVMPVAYAHTVVVLDVADPLHPREVSRLNVSPAMKPHWTDGEPGSDRFVITGQDDGEPRILLARLDTLRGRIVLDPTFHDPGSSLPGISYAARAGAATGAAIPHATVFVP